MIPEDKLEAVSRREAELSQLLCDPSVSSNPKRLQELTPTSITTKSYLKTPKATLLNYPT